MAQNQLQRWDDEDQPLSLPKDRADDLMDTIFAFQQMRANHLAAFHHLDIFMQEVNQRAMPILADPNRSQADKALLLKMLQQSKLTYAAELGILVGEKNEGLAKAALRPRPEVVVVRDVTPETVQPKRKDDPAIRSMGSIIAAILWVPFACILLPYLIANATHTQDSGASLLLIFGGVIVAGIGFKKLMDRAGNND